MRAGTLKKNRFEPPGAGADSPTSPVVSSKDLVGDAPPDSGPVGPVKKKGKLWARLDEVRGDSVCCTQLKADCVGIAREPSCATRP